MSLASGIIVCPIIVYSIIVRSIIVFQTICPTIYSKTFIYEKKKDLLYYI